MATKFKSKLETEFHKIHGSSLKGYETDKFAYTIEHLYTPDFKVSDNVFIETKGLFDAEDRRKILTIKKQNPNVTVALVFQNSASKIAKGSRTTYAEWCDKHEITWFDIKDTKSIKKFIEENNK